MRITPDFVASIFREQSGSYSIACSSLSVYTTGKTFAEARRNFKEALNLHFSVLRDKAVEALTQQALDELESQENFSFWSSEL